MRSILMSLMVVLVGVEARAAGPVVAPDGTVASACGAAPAGMSCVAGGPFIRGSDTPHECNQVLPTRLHPKKGRVDTAPAATVWEQTFYMDVTEVTFAAFGACIKSGKCTKAGPQYSDFSRPNQPIAGVSWFDADNYCRVQGKHLPTEAEWEKAARGPDGKAAPWGDAEATCDLAIIKDARGRSCGVKKLGAPDKGRPFEVMSRPAGVYGLYDMAGNIEEWTADWYSFDYAECGAACLGTNPKGICGGKKTCDGHPFKSVRGGSWYWEGSHANGYHRRPHYPINQLGDGGFHHFGFRCAASPEEAQALAH